MPGAAFVASALVEVPLAVVFLAVGAKVHKRSRLEGQPNLAWFAAFWVGVGAYGLLEALWSLAHLAGAATFPVALFVLHVKVAAMTAAFAGLVAYLLAIHGADRRVLAVHVGAYGVVLALTETFYSWREPIGQEAARWGMRLVYARADVEPWWTLLLLLLFLPPFLAALSYAMLLRSTTEPELRYRVALTSTSLVLFFAPLFLGWRAGDWLWWGAVEKALGALMALGIALALWPPPRLRRRLAEAPQRERVRESAFLERARQLV